MKPSPLGPNVGRAAPRGRGRCSPGGISLALAVVITLAIAAAFAGTARAQSATVVAVSGQPVSRGAGVLGEMDPPALHDSGDPVFTAALRSQGLFLGQGLFRATGGATVETLVLAGDPAPDSNGVFERSPEVRLNSAGHVAFGALLRLTLGGGLDAAGYFRIDPGGTEWFRLLRGNDPTPELDGLIQITTPEAFSINNHGHAVFTTLVRNSSLGLIDGVYLRDGDGLRKVIRRGDPVPATGGTILSLTPAPPPAISDAGHVLFLAEAAAPGSARFSGYYRWQEGSVILIVAQGGVLPDGSGRFGLLRPAALNNSGQVAFVDSILQGTPQGTADNSGVFRANGTEITQIARKSGLAPGNAGRYLQFGQEVAMNDRGQVLFSASLSGAANGADAGIFLGDGMETTTIALAGQIAPGGGRFRSFPPGDFALNHSSQVVFLAEIDLQNGGPTADLTGIFLYDPGVGILPVAREGDTLPGIGVITSLAFSSGSGPDGPSRSGLNELGEVAYHASAGGRHVVVLWSLGDPGHNQPPSGPGLSITANQNQTLSIPVSSMLEVMTDPEGGSVSLVGVDSESVEGGVVILIGDTVEYTPPTDFLGSDRFNYTVSDPLGATATAPVRITVGEPNNPPRIITPSGRFETGVIPGRVLTIRLADLLAVAVDPDDDPLTLGPIPPRTLGGAEIARSEGRLHLSWQDPAAFDRLLEAGDDEFNYEIRDDRGASVTVTARIEAASGITRFRITGSGASFTFQGSRGTWVLQRARAVEGPWEDVAEFQVSEGQVGASRFGTVTFTDPDPPEGGAFYRVRGEN